MLDVVSADNPLAVAGHNQPPSTPFDLSKQEIDDLYAEAKHWLDGEPVETQGQADGVAKLTKDLRAAIARADERRKVENKPFDEGKAEVQARYLTLIGDTKSAKGGAVLALETCDRALVPFLAKLEAEQRAKAEAARREAEEKRIAADEAIRASRADLQAREMAEALLRHAKAAEKIATKAEREKASAHGGGRAITMRKTLKAELTDRRAAMRHLWSICPERFDAVLEQVGNEFVKAGSRDLPGLLITEEVRAQ